MAEKPGETTTTETTSTTTTEEGGSSAGSENTETPPKETKAADESIPRSRLNEEINKRKEAEKLAEKLQKEQRERDEAAATEKGEWKNVADTRAARIAELEAEVAKLKERAERADVLEGQVRTSLKSRLEALPEEVRALAPDADGDMVALEKWLPNAEKLAQKQGTNGATGDGKGKAKDDSKGKSNTNGSARGAGPTPKASNDDAQKGELMERARASQAGFTARNF